MANYIESENALTQIVETLNASLSTFDSIGTNIQVRISSLTALITTYSDELATIDANAGVDAAWGTLKARKDNIQVNFLALRDDYIALETAYNAL